MNYLLLGIAVVVVILIVLFVYLYVSESSAKADVKQQLVKCQASQTELFESLDKCSRELKKCTESQNNSCYRWDIVDDMTEFDENWRPDMLLLDKVRHTGPKEIVEMEVYLATTRENDRQIVANLVRIEHVAAKTVDWRLYHVPIKDSKHDETVLREDSDVYAFVYKKNGKEVFTQATQAPANTLTPTCRNIDKSTYVVYVNESDVPEDDMQYRVKNAAEFDSKSSDKRVPALYVSYSGDGMSPFFSCKWIDNFKYIHTVQ